MRLGELSLDDRRYRKETGCIDDYGKRDSAEFVYRFDGVRWRATTVGTFRTTTATWTTDASGKRRLLEEGPPSSAEVELVWNGVGQERNRDSVHAFPCLVIICREVYVERIRDAELSGVVELGGVAVAVKFRQQTDGTMRWRKDI